MGVRVQEYARSVATLSGCGKMQKWVAMAERYPHSLREGQGEGENAP